MTSDMKMKGMNEMEITLQIQKIDVKHYNIPLTIDPDAVKRFARDKYALCRSFDEDEASEPNWWHGYIQEYVEDQYDPDLFFTENCTNHSNYQLESEECEFMDWVEEKANG